MDCSTLFEDLLQRLNQVVLSKWPQSLDGNAANWASANHPDLFCRWELQRKEAEELWLNGQVDGFRQAATEWGRLGLEIHRLYAAEIRQREAA